MSEETLVVSCIFGKNFRKVYSIPVPVPDNCEFYFFTNNPYLRNEILSKGWTYVYLNFELSSDEIISSLQSKFIKFLQFKYDRELNAKMPKPFSQFKKIIYYDHKFNVNAQCMRTIFGLMQEHKEKSIILRTTPMCKNTIWDEVNDANTQYRYRKNMDKTVQFINEKICRFEINENVRICNTGIIIYNNHENAQSMVDEVYDLCVKMQQPECQIFWAIVSQMQRYSSIIKTINWGDLAPDWVELP